MALQKFKINDTVEQKFIDIGQGVLSLIDQDLDAFYENGSESDPFLLMLYDEGRMPFSQRVPRNAFISFFRNLTDRFPFMGSFESFIFIMKQIFGETTEILFEIPSPGILEVVVNAGQSVDYEAIAREFTPPDVLTNYQLVTDDEDQLIFRGIAGISTEAELNLLFAEIIPAGVIRHITLNSFLITSFIAEDDDGISTMVTSFDDLIIFYEISGS